MLFVEPIAVAHSPTVSWLAVAFPVFRYLVAELTVTVSGPGLTVVVVLSAPVVVDVRPPGKAMCTPWTVIVEPDTAVTLPIAKATVPLGRVTVVRGRLPAPGKVPPVRPPNPPPPAPPRPAKPPAPPPKPRLHVPPVGEEIVTLVAFTAPAEPFAPVAVMQVPTITSLRLAFRLAMIVVEADTSTVV
jgi:outer membrane biosynthesis protein TonB